MTRHSTIPLLSFFLGFILLLVALDFAVERRSLEYEDYTPPIVEQHEGHGPVMSTPAYHGKSRLYFCRDSVATFYGHRPMEPWEREAFNQYQKPTGE